MTPASALRKDANRASLLVSPSRDMLAPPSGQRGTPYAPVAALNTRPCDSVRLGACRRPPAGSPPNGPGSLFKSGDCGLVLRVMARAGRELAVVHGPQLPAQRLLGDGEAELLPEPLDQIDQAPAHHAVDGRDRARI